MDAANIILAHMHTNNERVSVEQASLVLSHETGEYASTRDAQGVLESLRMQELVTYSAPTASCGTSMYPYFVLTTAGRAAALASYDDALSHAAHLLWLRA